MALNITGQDIIDYKPYLIKSSNFTKDNTVFDIYIQSSLKEVKRQFSSYLDYSSTEDCMLNIDSNEDYKICYIHYTYILYLESVSVKNDDGTQEVEYLKEAKKEYDGLFSRFLTICENKKNGTDNPLENNLDLIFG